MTLPPVLCYHKVERRHELGVTRISPRRFARQIERLARAGWKTLSLSEVIACARGDRIPAPNELAITFDDGYRGLREHAFPVLEAHGMRRDVLRDHGLRREVESLGCGVRREAIRASRVAGHAIMAMARDRVRVAHGDASAADAVLQCRG